MSSRRPYIILLNLTVFIALEAASLLLVSNNSIVQRSDVMRIVSAATNSVTGATGNVCKYFSLGKVNDRLMEENIALRRENSLLKDRLESMQLPGELPASTALFDYIPVRIVSNSTDRLHNILIIDKGTEDGVKEDMGVITDKGIIGYVQTAGEHYSKVSSILDTDNMASAILSSSGTFGVLQWNGTSATSTVLHDIPVHTVVNDGDTVVSSGYSLIYPAGIPLGTVSRRELRDGINYDLTIKLFEDFPRLRHAYVAVRKDIGELDRLMNGESEEEERP